MAPLIGNAYGRPNETQMLPTSFSYALLTISGRTARRARAITDPIDVLTRHGVYPRSDPSSSAHSVEPSRPQLGAHAGTHHQLNQASRARRAEQRQAPSAGTRDPQNHGAGARGAGSDHEPGLLSRLPLPACV